VKSLKPIGKIEIIDYFRLHHDLKFEIVEDYGGYSVTGEKLNYHSEHTNIDIIQLKPKYTSMECIEMETVALLKLFS